MTPRQAYKRQWNRENAQKKRHEWLAEHGPCRKCGTWAELEVDHIDPTKKTGAIVWGWRWERLLVALQDCQVLCRRCHRAKTLAERRPYLRPGSPLNPLNNPETQNRYIAELAKESMQGVVGDGLSGF